MDWQGKASEQIRQLLPATRAENLIRLIGFVHLLKGSETKYRRFALSQTPDELWDIHTEIQYALTFVGIGFEAGFEPLGDEGPDLMVTRGWALGLRRSEAVP
jgi:hypothetical protein